MTMTTDVDVLDGYMLADGLFVGQAMNVSHPAVWN
jgi:hypothetical protein